MLTVTDLWHDERWELPDDEALWRWTQDHQPHLMLKTPRTTDDLVRLIRGLQNYDVSRQDQSEATVVPGVTDLMRAAKMLAQPVDHDDPAWRAALVLHDRDREAAALTACGVAVTDEHRRALRGLAAVRPVEKAEVPGLDAVEPPKGPATAAEPEGELVARAVTAALELGRVEHPHLDGHPRHSQGTWLVQVDDGQILLKPGSGQQSPVRGVKEESATQSQREVACWYALDAMGLGAWAPRADLLTIDGRQYAAERWLGRGWGPADVADEVVLRHDWHHLLLGGQLHVLAAALWVLGDGDAHGHNTLVKDGGPRLIDFGSALAGDSFEPGSDPAAFTPFVLRLWAGEGYGLLTPVDRLAKLPRLGQASAEMVLAWLRAVDANGLGAALRRYGAQPGPTLRRLELLRGAAARVPADVAVNEAWTVGWDRDRVLP